MQAISTHADNHTRSFSASYKIVLILFVILAGTVSSVNAQVRMTGDRPQLFYGVGAFVSGSGHGTIFTESIGVQQFRNAYSVSACLQRRTMQVKGVRFTYAYELANNGSTLFSDSRKGSQQLNAFAFAQYLGKAPLSSGVANSENMVNPNQDLDWNDARLSTVELAAGVEFNVKIARRLQWKNSIGVSTYYRANYPAQMYNGRSSVVLTLGTGIAFIGS